MAEPVIEPVAEPVEFTRVLSGGREVYWRLTDGAYEVHTGDESKARVISSWDLAQNYLDGKSASI